MWRCAEQLLGYCQGEPDWATPPHDKKIAGEKAEADKVGGTCKLNHLTCGRFLTSLPDYSNIDLKGFQHSVVKGKKEDKLHKKVRETVEKMNEQGQLF